MPKRRKFDIIMGKWTMHGTAARFLIVVASMWTAALQLFSPSSLAFRAAGDHWQIDVVNWVVITIAGLGAADVIYHDILKRGLIWPSFPERQRHHVCVAIYSALAGAFAIRAFIATGDSGMAFQVGVYYVLFAVGITLEALAIAREERHQCPSESLDA